MRAIKSIIQWLKGVLKIGIVKDIKCLDYSVPESAENYMEQFIPIWREIYRGNPPWVQGNPKIQQLGVAKVLCEYVSNLNMAEYEIMVDYSKSKANEYVQKVLKDNAFHYNMRGLDEKAEALSGAVLKPYNIGKDIAIDYVTADHFLPLSWNNRRIMEGVFISRTPKGDNVYTKLEIHRFENGKLVIENKLFKASKHNKDELGTPEDLTALPEYANLLPRAEFDRDLPLFAYLSPAIANNKDFSVPFGVSRFANSIDTLKAIDEAFTNLQKERRKAQKKIFVTNQMLRYGFDQQNGARVSYDDSTDIYQIVDTVSMQDQIPIMFDPSFRISECVADMNHHLNLLCLQTGLSPGAISFDVATGIKTATEVKSENSKTFSTVASNQRILGQALEDLIYAILFLAQLPDFGTLPKGDYQVTVTFDDSVTPDRDSYMKEAVALKSAKMLSMYRFLTKYEGMTEEEAAAEMSRIQEETPSVPDVYSDFR